LGGTPIFLEILMKNILKSCLAMIYLFIALTPIDSYAADNSIELTVNSKIIQAELAITERAREVGLMNRASLCDECGMLFVFPSEDKWSFWSKNTQLPLSVAFIDKDGKIVQISHMKSNSIANHTSIYPVFYALEMRRGWFEKNGVSKGNIVMPLDIRHLKAND